MPSFKNMKQLEAYINKQAKEALYDRRETFEAVGQDHVQNDVYDKYDPTMYQGRGKLKESFRTDKVDNGIAIDNTRSEDGRDIAEIVEKGHYDSEGYNYVKKGAAYLLPRPFMQNTKQEIKDRNLHVTELQKGLKARGIDSKT